MTVFRSWAVHQAHFHRTWLTRTAPLDRERAEMLLEGMVYDGLWLTKFPLLFTPRYGVERLDAMNKSWQLGELDPEAVAELRPLIDADLVRFVLSLDDDTLERRVELFFGGRAMNKPLWNYLAAWLEHGAVLRGRLSPTPGMLDTVFSS